MQGTQTPSETLNRQLPLTHADSSGLTDAGTNRESNLPGADHQSAENRADISMPLWRRPENDSYKPPRKSAGLQTPGVTRTGCGGPPASQGCDRWLRCLCPSETGPLPLPAQVGRTGSGSVTSPERRGHSAAHLLSCRALRTPPHPACTFPP